MLSVDEVELIISICRELPVNSIVVNIGANIGTSTCAILTGCPSAYVYSVDKKEYPQELAHIADCGLSITRYQRILGDSTKLDFSWLKKANLVFVDGGHDDLTVLSDIATFRPKVPVGGYMLFHDYNHPIYATKPNVNLDLIVDREMAGWERVGQARYLVGFKRVN